MAMQFECHQQYTGYYEFGSNLAFVFSTSTPQSSQHSRSGSLWTHKH